MDSPPRPQAPVVGNTHLDAPSGQYPPSRPKWAIPTSGRITLVDLLFLDDKRRINVSAYASPGDYFLVRMNEATGLLMLTPTEERMTGRGSAVHVVDTRGRIGLGNSLPTSKVYYPEAWADGSIALMAITMVRSDKLEFAPPWTAEFIREITIPDS